MLSYTDQKRVDELTTKIGPETAVRQQLTELTIEVERLQSQLQPLEQQRANLVSTLADIDKAKVEASAIKTGKKR